MCLAVVKPKGAIVPLDYLDNAEETNSDGFGVAWIDERGKLMRTRTMHFESFKAKVKEIGELPAIIHLRFGTHGVKGETNCHPFWVQDGADWLAMIHNGIISGLELQKDESDTAALARILSNLPAGWSKCPSSMALVAGVARGSKLAFLRANGEHFIVHEDDGHWKDGVWYSNDGYEPSFDWRKYQDYGMDRFTLSGFGSGAKPAKQGDEWEGLEELNDKDWDELYPTEPVAPVTVHKPKYRYNRGKWFSRKPGVVFYVNPKGKP